MHGIAAGILLPLSVLVGPGGACAAERPPLRTAVNELAVGAGARLPFSAARSYRAAEEHPERNAEKEGSDGPSLLATLEDTHASITRNLEYSVRRVDAFFANERVFQEATDSYLRVEGSSSWQEGKGADLGGDIKARAELPRLERKWALLLESDEQALREEKDDSIRRRPKEAVRQNNYFLSIQKRLNGDSRWDIRPAAGVKLKIPPDPFARLSAYRYYGLGDWLGRLSGDVSWFVSDGLGTEAQWELDRAFKHNMLFRSSSIIGWEEKDDHFKAEQKLTLFHDFGDKDAFAYEVGTKAANSHLWAITEYYLRANYRRELARRWLYLDIAPEITYPREKAFAPRPALTVSLGIIFGREYLEHSEGR
ncbi:hypothetical protein [Thiohalorhabdus methylotrophus]|uniref:DUF3570 domain-containing protein n=1 Tax=Thiohalorhabdus methylotrophus TaxID=3242694 RepID=A0ABV4TVJ8_9GAMM